MNNFIITIARQYGSGGKTIGKMLAKKLSIPCYDREIITMASEDSGINQELFSDEKLKLGFFSSFLRKFKDNKLVSPESSAFIENDNLFNYQAKIISKLADEGPCVIIGRCADYVLKDRKDTVRVLIHAPNDFCYEQAAKVDSLPENELKKKIAQIDEYRGKFYEYFTGEKWLNAKNYDLCINSAVLGFEGTVKEIESYLEIKNSI